MHRCNPAIHLKFYTVLKQARDVGLCGSCEIRQREFYPQCAISNLKRKWRILVNARNTTLNDYILWPKYHRIDHNFAVLTIHILCGFKVSFLVKHMYRRFRLTRPNIPLNPLLEHVKKLKKAACMSQLEHSNNVAH